MTLNLQQALARLPLVAILRGMRLSDALIQEQAIRTAVLARISHRFATRWRRTLDSRCIVHAPRILTVFASVENVLWIQDTSQIE